MTLKKYVVTGPNGLNLRKCPSTSYPSSQPALFVKKGQTVSVIHDWYAVNSVGSTTKYLPVLVSNSVYYAAANLLSPHTDYLAAVAKQAPIVYNKITNLHCKHRGGTKSWDALLKNKYINCSGAVSIVLQRAGLLPKNCVLNHRPSVGNTKALSSKNSPQKAMSGSQFLVPGSCSIAKIGKTYAKMPSQYKKAGVVYVQDSNICISAGNGYIYSCNEAANQMKNGKYSCTKVKSGYPFSSPILFAVVPN